MISESGPAPPGWPVTGAVAVVGAVAVALAAARARLIASFGEKGPTFGRVSLWEKVAPSGPFSWTLRVVVHLVAPVRLQPGPILCKPAAPAKPNSGLAHCSQLAALVWFESRRELAGGKSAANGRRLASRHKSPVRAAICIITCKHEFGSLQVKSISHWEDSAGRLAWSWPAQA